MHIYSRASHQTAQCACLIVRIAIDARAYFQRTGIARYTRGLIHALAHWGSQHRFLVLISDQHRADEVPLPPHMTVRVSRAGWLQPDEAAQLEREATAWRAELFHAIFPPLALAGIPSVTTVFDVTPLTQPDVHVHVVQSAFGAAWKGACRHGARMVAVSQATREAAVAQGADERRMSVIGIGLSPPFDTPLPPAWRDQPRDGVLCVGTLEPRKNIEVIVDAFESLQSRGLQPRLTLVGKGGWGEARWHDRLHGLPQVAVAGFVTDDQLLRLYQQAALLVCPSREEGFGLPVLEAMAQGVVPIVSPAAALVELVRDPRLVAVADGAALAEAIAWWLDHPVERIDMARRLHLDSQKHSWRAVAAQWLALYVTGRS